MTGELDLTCPVLNFIGVIVLCGAIDSFQKLYKKSSQLFSNLVWLVTI